MIGQLSEFGRRGRARTATGGAPARAILLAIVLAVTTLAAAQVVPAPAPRFDISRFEVIGNSLLSAEEVERAVSAHRGRDRDLADIQRAVEALELAYRTRGYSVVRVVLPEQDISSGTVRVRVIEPVIGRVTIDGNRFFGEANVRAGLPAIREGTIPDSNAIARNLHLLSEQPAKRTEVLLRATEREDRLDVALRVTEEDPVRYTVALDNSGTRETGRFRLRLGYQNANLLDRDDALNVQYVTSPGHVSRVTILGLGYRAPLYGLNSAIELTAGYSDVDSGVIQNLFTVSGSGTTVGARWVWYLPRWGDLEQKLALGLDYRAFRNRIQFAGQPILPDITLRPASITWSGLVRGAGSEAGYYLQAARNIPGGADGGGNAFRLTRAGADPYYSLLRFGGHWAQVFANDMQFRALVSGQVTRDSLVAGEQFGIGGAYSVRGFLERDRSDDQGHALTAELYSPDLARLFDWTGATLRVLAFADAGRTGRVKALPGEVRRNGLASAGLGLRYGLDRRLAARLDLAQILNGGGSRRAGEWRGVFSVAWSM